MKQISLYFFRQVLTAFLFAVVAITIVVLMTQSFRLLTLVIDNSGTMAIFAQLMGLLVPTFLPLVVPLSLGVAVIFIYHKFAIDSELVVLRAAGISPFRLAMPALTLAAMVVVLCYALTIVIAPAANRELVKVQFRVRDNFSVFLLRPGAFNDLAEGLTFYVRTRGKDGELKDILIHDNRSPQKPVTIMAARGQFEIVDGEPRVTIYKGKRQELDRQTGRLSQVDFGQYVLDLHVLRKSMNNRLPDPREQTLSELLNPPSDPAKRKTTLEHVTAELHQRLSVPLLALSYTIIGLTVILAGEFNRRGMMKRIFIAAAAIICLQAATLWLSSLIGKDVMFIPAIYAVIIAPVPICIAILVAPEWCRRLLKIKPRTQSLQSFVSP